VNAQGIACPSCRAPLPEAAWQNGPVQCPACRKGIELEVFPALFAGPRIGRPGEPLVDASEASCFFHAEKRAAVACESCGRFLCALCDLEVDGRHICPSCLAAGRKKGAMKGLDQFRLSWPGIALLMAIVLPLAFYPLTPLWGASALVALAIGLRKPGSITGRRRWLVWTFALVLALGELIGGILLGKALFESYLKNPL
jgi:hypothetical protein